VTLSGAIACYELFKRTFTFIRALETNAFKLC